MPYLTQEARNNLQQKFASSPGELNFLFTSTINAYLTTNQLSYQTINNIIGALEGAKLEFYRRVAGPYESQKCYEHGDVYDFK